MAKVKRKIVMYNPAEDMAGWDTIANAEDNWAKNAFGLMFGGSLVRGTDLIKKDEPFLILSSRGRRFIRVVSSNGRILWVPFIYKKNFKVKEQ